MGISTAKQALHARRPIVAGKTKSPRGPFTRATMSRVISGGRWQGKAVAAFLALALGPWSVPRGAAQTAAGPGAEAARRPAGKLDLRLKGELATGVIEGAWTYEPLDGSTPYRLSIQKSKDGFYQYEGRGKERDRPVLQFDKTDENTTYRGQVGEGFDPCIPAGAQFRLYPTGGSLVFEPSMPVDAPVPRTPQGPCSEATRYFLASRGRGDEVRLRPQSDLAGSAAAPDPRADLGRIPKGGGGRPSENAPTANVTLGMPSVPDGTQVLLLGSVRDGNSKVWHHVKLLAPLEAQDGGRRSQEVSAAENEDTEALPEKRADAPVRGGATSPRRDPALEGGRAPKGAGSAAAANPKGGGEPHSGYVPAANLVIRWECRLLRAGTDGAEPAGESG